MRKENTLGQQSKTTHIQVGSSRRPPELGKQQDPGLGAQHWMGKHANRPDLAWWPPDRRPGGKSYFYRPGQLLIKNGRENEVKRALAALGAQLQPDPPRDPVPHVVRGLVISAHPVPLLLESLSS